MFLYTHTLYTPCLFSPAILFSGLNVTDIWDHSYSIFTRKASSLIPPWADFPRGHSCALHIGPSHPEFFHPSSPSMPAMPLNPLPADTFPNT